MTNRYLYGMPAALALLFAAVGHSAPVTPPAAASRAPSFSASIVPVLKTRCVACHATGQEAGGMALYPAAAYKNLVGAPSTEAPKLVRVAPGKPAASYLMLKLEGKHIAAGGTGARMPLGGKPLDPATIQLFRSWIAAGAPNN